jgi:superfamily II DNA or RNA helicase
MTRPGIVDNETDDYHLSKFLREQLKKPLKGLDIATGYINVGGYHLLKEELDAAASRRDFVFRLIYGKETVSRIHIDERTQPEGELDLRTELESAEVTAENAGIIDSFLDFLKKENVYVKRNKERFSHAKCYIFVPEDVAVVGSSNFTPNGLRNNIELNAVIYQPEVAENVEKWFERRWAEAEDAKQELIETLEESKFGRPLDPFTFYMKFLYEYYKPRLIDYETESHSILELASFQKDAVTSALRILRRFNGVLIADSTGLGKTFIGVELLRRLVSVEGKKALLIAPAQVKDSIWEPILFLQSIKTKSISLEITGTRGFDPKDYLDYDVVLIDESHNYRNSTTNRFSNIMKVLSGGRRKLLILMSATPVNNSLFDLYNQFSLITTGDDAYFAGIGVADMRQTFLRAERKSLAQGLADITRLLDELVVRRTRTFIKDNYPDAEINGKKVTFPVRALEKVEYSLTQIFGSDIYDEVIETIDSLHLVPYRLNYYRRSLSDKEKAEADQRATLQQFTLLKRFESSVEAIRKSVKRLVRFYESFEKSVESEKILRSDDFQDLVSEFEDLDEDNEETFYEKLEKLELESLSKDYDKQAILNELKDDLSKLRNFAPSLDKMQPWADRKLNALKEQFAKDSVFDRDSRKVVVFTQFVDTAKYLYEQLKKEFGSKGIDILTGETDSNTRKKILHRFAPKSNPQEGSDSQAESSILISTDILSEGQNLQDCNYVVNYDLPWNPMKIVQRVGRVDRLGSDWDTVRNVVFIPEKELNSLLGLMEKLETRIKKAKETIGTEATILGEIENPKTFNAVITRMSRNDNTLIDELEAQAEALPSDVGAFQMILMYIKNEGSKKLEAIPLGKKSGKNSGVNGVILFYRETGDAEGIHLVFYDYDQSKCIRYNEVNWTLNEVACGTDEELVLPLIGDAAFKHFEKVDQEAREYILPNVNAACTAASTFKIRLRYQALLVNEILAAYKEGEVDMDLANKVYSTLNKRNLPAYEDEFERIYKDYLRHKNRGEMVKELNLIIEKYRIRRTENLHPKIIKPEDLELVCYTYLSKPGASWNKLTA